jgi:hypothetical protein
LIGLTTNHEHGFWLARQPRKLVYGRPDDSYRNTYLDLMFDFDAQQEYREKDIIHNSLAATIAASIERANHCRKRFREISRVRVESPYGEFSM